MISHLGCRVDVSLTVNIGEIDPQFPETCRKYLNLVPFLEFVHTGKLTVESVEIEFLGYTFKLKYKICY